MGRLFRPSGSPPSGKLIATDGRGLAVPPGVLTRWCISIAIVPVAVLMAMSSLHGDADAVRLEPSVARYLDGAAQRVTTYRAFRRLEAEGMGHTGWIEAWTELQGQTFRYEITAEGGSEGVRNRVLYKVLESERQAWATGEVSRSELTPANYDFERSPDQPASLLKILVKPRHKGKLMLDGAMFLAREEADLVRVEGRAVSNPSFWVKRVDIKKDYQRINGATVPIAVESIASIRFAGKATFRMSYEYTQVNGRSTLGTVNAIASATR